MEVEFSPAFGNTINKGDMQGLIMIKRIATGVVCAVTILFSVAIAADDPEYLIQYRQYTQAVEAGDKAKAEGHARAAWQAAEEELGDDRLTAILAYNYANLVMDRDPAMAIAPYERALALVEQGFAEISANDIRMQLAMLDVMNKNNTGTRRRALFKALEARKAAGEAPNTWSIDGWLVLARARMANQDFDGAVIAADQAIADARAIGKTRNRLFANALALAGAARLAGGDRLSKEITDAMLLLDEAISLFPPQPNIDEFDSLLATALAWRGVATAAAQTDGDQRAIENYELQKDIDLGSYQWAEARAGECEITWKKRKPPEFPWRASDRGYFGSAIIGYDIDATGRVERTRILAEVPSPYFGQVSENSLKDWEGEWSAPPSESCRRNNLVQFTFTFGN